jgi:hypothetical protein
MKAVLLLTILLAGAGLALQSSFFVGDQPDPPFPEPSTTGVSCFREGGVHSYCECLYRLESARKAAGLPAPGKLPPLDDPRIRYAMAHPQLYPIINADTLRCMSPPKPPPRPARPGTPA